MKRFSVMLAAAVAAFGLASCNKDAQPVQGPDAEGSNPVRLVVGVEGSMSSKAIGVTGAEEAKVNSLQVLVFNGASLDGYGSSTGSLEASVTCSEGVRDIYAVVNGPDLSAVSTKENFLASVAELRNEQDNFVMVGGRSETLKQDANVSIEVNRLAARVVIRGIKNSLENDAQANNFKLLAVYLTNVAGDVDFGVSPSYEVSKWYNRRGYESTNSIGSFDYDAITGAAASVAKGGTYSVQHNFYSMPNAKNDISGIEEGASGWTPRRARLVISAEIAGNVYKYPVLLPVLQSNKSYEISLVNLTRLGNPDDGNDDPDDPNNNDDEESISGVSQGFEVVVKDWSVVLVNGDGNITI